jgi:hypothetical protein
MSHRRQSFYFILSLLLLLSKGPCHARDSVGRRKSSQLSVPLTTPRLRALHRAKDIGSALKGGVNVCQRQLVDEVLGPLGTEFIRNLGREGATPNQRGSNASLLGRVQAVELIRHNALRFSEPSPRPVGRLLSAPGSKWCGQPAPCPTRPGGVLVLAKDKPFGTSRAAVYQSVTLRGDCGIALSPARRWGFFLCCPLLGRWCRRSSIWRRGPFGASKTRHFERAASLRRSCSCTV